MKPPRNRPPASRLSIVVAVPAPTTTQAPPTRLQAPIRAHQRSTPGSRVCRNRWSPAGGGGRTRHDKAIAPAAQGIGHGSQHGIPGDVGDHDPVRRRACAHQAGQLRRRGRGAAPSPDHCRPSCRPARRVLPQSMQRIMPGAGNVAGQDAPHPTCGCEQQTAVAVGPRQRPAMPAALPATPRPGDPCQAWRACQSACGPANPWPAKRSSTSAWAAKRRQQPMTIGQAGSASTSPPPAAVGRRPAAADESDADHRLDAAPIDDQFDQNSGELGETLPGARARRWATSGRPCGAAGPPGPAPPRRRPPGKAGKPRWWAAKPPNREKVRPSPGSASQVRPRLPGRPSGARPPPPSPPAPRPRPDAGFRYWSNRIRPGRQSKRPARGPSRT